MTVRPAPVIVGFVISTCLAGTRDEEPVTITRRGPVVVAETNHLLCEIRPDARKRGVVRCRYRPKGYEIVPDVPKHALLMPEWLLKPHTPRRGIFWAPLKARPDMTVENNSVIFRVSADQTGDWNMDMAFRYTLRRDWIDFECRILPHTAIPDFEIFVALYIIEDMESTWVSAATREGEVFTKLDNRRTVGLPFAIARDARAKAYLSDGRWNVRGLESDRGLRPGFFFKRPILIAMKESTGLAVVIMVEPNRCSLLAGQHHREETAHDFAFCGDLKPEQPFLGRARLVVRPIGSFPGAKKQIDTMCNEFMEALH